MNPQRPMSRPAPTKKFLWSRNLTRRVGFRTRFVVFPCRKVQVSSIAKLNGKMLFSRLDPAETSTTPTLPPTNLASVRNDGGEGKPCLGRRTSQDLPIPQPLWTRSWKSDCYVSCWISDLGKSQKLFLCSVPYDDLNMKGDNPTFMVFSVTCLISTNPNLSATLWSIRSGKNCQTSSEKDSQKTVHFCPLLTAILSVCLFIELYYNVMMCACSELYYNITMCTHSEGCFYNFLCVCTSWKKSLVFKQKWVDLERCLSPT